MDANSRIVDIRAGVFVLVSIGLLLAGLFWVAGTGFLAKRHVGYVILMPDSGGIQPGDRVRVAGVPVGKIRDVDLLPADEWPVRFQVSIRSDVSLHEDAAAKLATTGLLGASYLQIEPGDASAPLLPPGAEIHGESAAGIASAMEQLDELGAKLMALLDQTSGVIEKVSSDVEVVMKGAGELLSDENVRAIGELLHSMNQTMADAGPQLSGLLARLDSVAQRADEGLSGLPELEAELQTLLGDLHVAIGPEGQRLSELLDTANGTLESAEEALGMLGSNDQELRATFRDLRDTVANLKAFSQTIKERPYSLVRMKTPPARVPGEGIK